MEKLKLTAGPGIKPVVLFSALVLCIIVVLAVIGYNYLTFRNFLMLDAATRSGRMSLRTQSQNLERNIYQLEHRMILDIASGYHDTITAGDLASYSAKHPIASNICVYNGADVSCSGEEVKSWLEDRLKKDAGLLNLVPLTLYHFAGYLDKDKPVQAGATLISGAEQGKAPLVLLYTLDLDYINDVLMPESIDTKNPFLAGNTFILSAPLTDEEKNDRNKLYIEYGFRDILPFWMVSSYINAADMKHRARIEIVNYMGFIALLVLLTLASSYFIWKQMQQENELSKVKSQMMSHVSHELKTPLSLIRMYSETLMLGRVNGGKSMNYYQTILSECDRLHLLINNTLDISSIEKGMKEYNFTKGDISAVVGDMVSSYEAYIKGHGFGFHADISSDIPDLLFDRQAVNQIVGNLLDNAMKFSPDEKYIDVRMHMDSGRVKLTVTDHGIGIEEDQLDNIFKPYHRLSERYRGSGLGLSLVKHSVEAHHGTISVSSMPGGGSRFTVTLPVYREERDVVKG